jgi:DNA-binding NtrC family response regulator
MFRPDEYDLKLAVQSDVAVLVTAQMAADRLALAQLIHSRSDRARGPLVVLDCGGRTSRTDAVLQAFEHAHGGTLFIQDVASLDAKAQAALLSLLENERVPRDSAVATVAPGVRVIAGANRSLYEAIGPEGFSERLYYRLNVIHVNGDK